MEKFYAPENRIVATWMRLPWGLVGGVRVRKTEKCKENMLLCRIYTHVHYSRTFARGRYSLTVSDFFQSSVGPSGWGLSMRLSWTVDWGTWGKGKGDCVGWGYCY